MNIYSIAIGVILSTPWTAQAQPKSDLPKQNNLFTAIPGKGITFSTSDEKYSINIKSRIQIRESLLIKDEQAQTDFHIKTLRLTLQGSIYDPKFKYNIQLAFGGNDFEPGNASPIFDAWIESTHLRDLNIRIGQFIVPFDRARTMREFALQMVDRPLVVKELTLDRDIGIMFFSRALFGIPSLGYHVFLGAGDGRNSFGYKSAGPLGVIRLVFRPFGKFDDDDIEGDVHLEKKPRITIGFALAYNQDTHRSQSTYGNVFQSGSVNYFHAVADTIFKYKGFSFLGEAVLRKAENKDQINSNEWSRSGYGYVLQSGMMITSMFEVVGRFEQLFSLGNTDPNLVKIVHTQGNQGGGGFNVYLNGHALKFQADYTYMFGTNYPNSQHLFRFQIDASF